MSWRPAPLALLVVACTNPSPTPLRPRPMVASDAGVAIERCLDEAYVATEILASNCANGGCHDADEPKADLDLSSPGLRARVLSARSIISDCDGMPLVDPDVPSASVLFDKLLSPAPRCGDPMPPRGELSPEELRCLTEFFLEP